MTTLTQEGFQKIIADNIYTVYHLPEGYENIHHYLKGNVRKTLLQVLNFLKDRNIVIDKHTYLFFLDNGRLTNQVRKQPYTQATSNRYMRMLCAMGFFTRVNRETMVNHNFHDNQPSRRRDINFYKISRYTEKELKRIEGRARQLKEAGVTIGNISFNMLVLNGCDDIAREIYPANNPLAPEKKELEYVELINCLDTLIDTYGYATREQLQDNMSSIVSDAELDKLLKIFRKYLVKRYCYKRPTKLQKEKYNLKSNKYIYTPRKEKADEEGNEDKQGKKKEWRVYKVVQSAGKCSGCSYV